MEKIKEERFSDWRGRGKKIIYRNGIIEEILETPNIKYIRDVLNPLKEEREREKEKEERGRKISRKIREIAQREIENEKKK